MSDLLWQKPGVAVDARIQAFLAGDDVLLDREFFLHDIAASAAHAEGLQRIGILPACGLEGRKPELPVPLTVEFNGDTEAAVIPQIEKLETRPLTRAGPSGRHGSGRCSSPSRCDARLPEPRDGRTPGPDRPAPRVGGLER